MSDNIDEILKLKANDRDAPKSTYLGAIMAAKFTPSGFVLFLKVIAWISAIVGFYLFIFNKDVII